MANVGSGASGKTLIGNGNGQGPKYADIGTNSGLTLHGVVISEGAGAFTATGAGTAGQVLTSAGPLADPSFQPISSSGAVITISGNSGVASPSGGNLNLITANSTVKFVGSGSTLTQDFNLSNIALGTSLPSLTSGAFNVIVGAGSTGAATTSGSGNVLMGYGTSTLISTGSNNTIIGVGAGGAITTASSSVGIGSGSLAAMTTGASSNNTAVGTSSLSGITTGNYNLGLGIGAGSSLTTTDSSNITIMHAGVSGDTHALRLGTDGSGNGQINKSFIAGITGVTVAASAPMGVASTGQLSSLGFGSSAQVLTSNGAGVTPSFQAVSASSLITTYNSSGSWTIDSRTKSVEFYVMSGGGGGGSGRSGASGTAGGGAGGGPGNLYYFKTVAALLVSSPYTVTVGDGGAGGALVNGVGVPGNPGIIGGTSSVGSIIVVLGGGPGTGGIGTAGQGSFLNQHAGAAGGITLGGSNGSNTNPSAATSAIYAWATGGAGGAGYTAATPRTGAAGGSILGGDGTVLVAGGLAGANTGAAAGNGNPPTGIQLMLGGTGGGSGGHDGVTTAGDGGDGAAPGGGGGGGAGNLSSNNSGAGGDGGKGQVIIIEYF